MAKDKLGTKQVCPSCEVKFYDLNKRPAVCPKCDHAFDPEDDVIKTVKAKVQAKAAKEAEKTVAGEDEIEDDKAAAPEIDADEDEAEEEGAAELSGGPEDIVLDISGDGDDDDACKIDDEADDGALDLGGDED